MNSDITHQVAARFDTAASTYDQVPDAVQPRVAAAAGARLLTTWDGAAPARILEIGCGTGVFTAWLAARFPTAMIDACDLAPRMLEMARQRLEAGPPPPGARVRWLAADVRELPVTATYDLIASSSVLHWLTPLPNTIAHLAALLLPNGRLAAALMLQDTLAGLFSARHAVAPDKPPRFLLPTRAAVLEAIHAAGLTLETAEDQYYEQQHASVTDMLHGLHAQGVTGGFYTPDRLLTPAELRRLAQLYASAHPATSGDGVRSVYHVLFLRARNAA